MLVVGILVFLVPRIMVRDDQRTIGERLGRFQIYAGRYASHIALADENSAEHTYTTSDALALAILRRVR